MEQIEVQLIAKNGDLVKRVEIPHFLTGLPDVLMLGDRLFTKVKPPINAPAYVEANIYEIRLNEDCPIQEWSDNQ